MGSLDLNHSTPQPVDISGPLNALIDWACTVKAKAEYDATRGKGDNDVAYKRIGAGYIGLPCARELAYKYHKYPKDPDDGSGYPKGQLARHAAAGHWTEAATVEWMTYAGFNVSTFVSNPDGTPKLDYAGKPKQHGFMSAPDSKGKFRLAGELDGLILGKPEKLPIDMPEEARIELEKILAKMPIPCAYESKKATDKKWKKFSKDGVKKADPKYYGQLQTGMAYCGLEAALFSMLNLDTMIYYFELVWFDIETAQRLTDRAVKVFESDVPEDLPRVTSKPDNFQCSFCEYKKTQCFRDHFNPVQRRVDTDGTDTSLPWNGVPVWGNGAPYHAGFPIDDSDLAPR